jgi:hypothetical protein
MARSGGIAACTVVRIIFFVVFISVLTPVKSLGGSGIIAWTWFSAPSSAPPFG